MDHTTVKFYAWPGTQSINMLFYSLALKFWVQILTGQFNQTVFKLSTMIFKQRCTIHISNFHCLITLNPCIYRTFYSKLQKEHFLLKFVKVICANFIFLQKNLKLGMGSCNRCRFLPLVIFFKSFNSKLPNVLICRQNVTKLQLNLAALSF